MKNRKKQAPKERNPFVQHLINRKGGGVHQKSKKAERQKEKAQLKKDYLDESIALVDFSE